MRAHAAAHPPQQTNHTECWYYCRTAEGHDHRRSRGVATVCDDVHQREAPQSALT
jgi:hypothetical protein